jgi:hypothetical protein
LRVLLSIFVKRISKQESGQVWFVVSDSLCLDQVRLEAVLFWSLIHILEVGEIRRFLTGTRESVYEQITDFLYVVLPSSYVLCHAGNKDSFDAITLDVTTYLGSCLPLCDCTNLWLAAFSRKNPMNFLNAVFIVAFVLGVAVYKRKPSVAAMEASFQLTDSQYLLAAAFRFADKYQDIFRRELPKQ